MPDCNSCETAVSTYDRFCGTCGESLSPLALSAGGSGHSGDSCRSAVRKGEDSVSVTVTNPGVVTGALTIDSAVLQLLPQWVDRQRMSDVVSHVHNVGPGESIEVLVPLNAEAIEQMYRQVAQPADQTTELSLTILTSSPRTSTPDDDGVVQWEPKPLTFTLVAAREPWLQPNASVYPFLPLEAIGAGFKHQVRLRNESTSNIRITEIEIQTGRTLGTGVGPDAPNVLQLDAGELITHDGYASETIAAGKSKEFNLTIGPPNTELAPGQVGWFSAYLKCSYSKTGDDGQEYGHTETIEALVEGTIGVGPTLAAAPGQPGEVEEAQVQNEYREGCIRIGNPGDLPVRLTQVEVLRAGARRGQVEAAPLEDWLVIDTDGLQVGSVVGPGEIREIQYEIRPDQRPEFPPTELSNDWPERVLRIHHDGWCPDGAQPFVEFKVKAQLGKLTISPVVLGIDFGTSNSMVCVTFGAGPAMKVKPLLLERAGMSQLEQLASLMFFKGSSSTDQHQHFEYGSAAGNLAETMPSALVRSIKSVIAREPTLPYNFVRPDIDGSFSLSQFRSQKLLNLFIAELRRRAERAVAFLTPTEQDAMGVSGARVRFNRAIFTHPVNIDRNMKQALMTAAHAAGLNTEITNLSEFIQHKCVDEASSAILAYTRGRLSGQIGRNHQKPPIERVLCFDMGGGTTDIAAMEVHGLDQFQSNKKVRVVLCEITGDSRFGGDDLDEAIAAWVLDEVANVAEQSNVRLDLMELKNAIECSTFTRYHEGLQARGIQGSTSNEDLVMAYAQLVWRKAEDILVHSEKMKRNLSKKNECSFSLPKGDWPVYGKAGQPGTIGTKVIKVTITKERFEKWINEQVDSRMQLIEDTVVNSDWKWSEVSTVLFTGQSVRVNAIRDTVLALINARRSATEDAGDLLVVQPDDGNGFCPKQCVAEGAVLWQQQSSWVDHESRPADQLTADLQKSGFMSCDSIAGLERGMKFPIDQNGTRHPIEVNLKLDTKVPAFTVFRNNREYVRFNFPAQATDELKLRVYGPADLSVIIDGYETQGVPV
jgi:molecular chaperone DnaK (HSP70)